MQEKLSLRSKLSFGIGAFGKDMVYAIVSAFFMKYLTDYRLVDPLFVAVLFAAVAILFTAPLGSLAIDLLLRKTKIFRSEKPACAAAADCTGEETTYGSAIGTDGDGIGKTQSGFDDTTVPHTDGETGEKPFDGESVDVADGKDR